MSHDSKPSALPALFVPVPEWIVVAGLTPQALALYTVLLAHVNRQRGDGLAWPSMATLGDLLGFKTRRSVAQYTRELVSIGAVVVGRREKSNDRRNEYLVRESPPDDYTGFRSLAEFHANRRAEEGPRDTTVCIGRDTAVPVARDTEVSPSQTKVTRRTEPDEPTSSDAYAAVGQRASSQTATETARPIKIRVPKGFYDESVWDDGHAAQHLVKASVGALRAAGYELAPDATDRLGGAINCSSDGLGRRALVKALEGTLALAGTGHGTWGNLAVYVGKAG